MVGFKPAEAGGAGSTEYHYCDTAHAAPCGDDKGHFESVDKSFL